VLHLLYNSLKDWLNDHGLGFFRLFNFISFRAVAALIVAFLTVIVLGKPTIRYLLKLKIGDNPQFYRADLNEIMKDKSKTPTMGGVLIWFAITLATLLLADLGNTYVHLSLLCLLWLTAVGGADDLLKLTTARRKPGSRDGLRSWEKLLFQMGLAVILGVFMYHHGQSNDVQTMRMAYSLNLPLLNSWEWDPQARQYVPSSDLIVLAPWAFVLLSIFIITGFSNAVNLTDGMDGLASGVTAICGLAFVILTLLAGNEKVAKELLIPFVPRADELSVVCAALVGACLGFLWFNCNPAQVFMGDTGSLPLGGLLGFVAVVIRQEFLLLVIGGIFVYETLSVILQVGYFKLTGGKRIFRCAPVHHHYRLGGWSEQQVVVRFWLISAMLTAVALALIKLR
jgi:phospho-N-acetylmuramoyl-pentapeptide-transferase